MPTNAPFGQWLRQRRKALDLTREALAQAIGCAVVTLNKIEAGERRPSIQMASLLAEHLQIPSEDRANFIHFSRTEAIDSGAPGGTPVHPPNNVPAQPTVLIGREADAAAVRSRLLRPETRLLTLVGPPGIGKTRLSLQVAVDTLDDFADGVFFVVLAPITDAALVPGIIASTLGTPETGPHTPLERLKTYLQDKQMLLVLDNFEQIVAAAPLVAELVAACLWLKILVTSRAPLRIRQERQLPVAPLALPDLTQLPDVEAMSQYAAVTLFIERAQAVKPEFVLTNDNAQPVAAICTRLDGLPLAIELVSAHVKLLSPAILLERLGGQLMLQSDGLRDIEPRHRTLNAAIDWSYQLLSPEEQELFRWFGVFRGWMLEAAEALCAEHSSLNALDGLSSLLDKNLIRQDTTIAEQSRWMMLETIREYALDRLRAEGELERAQAWHADYFAKVAEASEREAGLERQQKWDFQEAELTNFRAALNWGRTEAGGRILLRLSVALGDFWGRRGYLDESVRWAKEALMQSKKVADPFYRKLRADVLDGLAVNYQWQGKLDAAKECHAEGIPIYRELGNLPGLAQSLATYGMLYVLRGDAEGAISPLEESLTIYREIGAPDGIALCTCFLGEVAYIRHDLAQAYERWHESLIGMRAVNDDWMTANLLSSLGMVQLEQGHYEQARADLRASIVIHRALSEKWQSLDSLEFFAGVAIETSSPFSRDGTRLLLAARLLGVAEQLRETYASNRLLSHQRAYTQIVDGLQAKLDAPALAEAWAAGRRLTWEQAIELALEV
jgi:predicted ATPase/transcriptional regulator with XRE-family HTH domain